MLLLALGLLAPLASCKKHQEGDGHDHGTPAAEGQHAEGDGHDHGGSAAGHVDEVKLTAEAVDRHAIRVGEAQLWMLRPTFTAPARIGFNTEAMAHVGSPLRGRVVEISVRLGDDVKKNDPLAIVESPELGQAQADFLMKRTAARNAAPQVELARAAWDRARGLFEQSQGISLAEVQKREGEYRGAEAGLRLAEATAVAAENALHLLGMDQEAVKDLASTGEISPRFAVRAAIAGQVVQREVTLGELVGPERESLMVLADTSTLWVLADVPEATLASVGIGARAWVAMGQRTSRVYEGAVAFIAPLVDPVTRTAQVRVEIPSAALGSGAIRPGMFAQVEIVASGDENPAPQVAVPQEAVQIVEGRPAVFVPVKGEPNTFQKRIVSIGRAVGGLVPVYSGLVEGEPFVESGTFILKAELGKGEAGHEH